MAMPPRKWRSPATSGVQIIYIYIWILDNNIVLKDGNGKHPCSILHTESTMAMEAKMTQVGILFIKSGFYLDRLSRNTLPETWFGIGSGPILGSPYISIHITGGLDLLLQCSCCSHLISSVGSVRNCVGPGSKFQQTSCWLSIELSRILAPNFQSYRVCPKKG